MRVLNVFLHDRPIGRLERVEQARLRFTYSENAGGEPPLSLSLPLREEPFDDADCRPFFGGLLPEGGFLRAVARAFHVSAENPFSMLAAIGGECAGAVSLSGPGSPPPRGGAPKWLNATELAELIRELPMRPLLAGGEDDGLRLSLAGAQEKLPVIFQGGHVGITRGAPHSTHIIKLPDERFKDLTANEAYCLALAGQVELDVVRAGPRIASSRAAIEPQPDDLPYLLVWRYDRTEDGRRIHQEDLCQALGVVAEDKYEAEGGPNTAACSTLLRRHSAVPATDLLAFCDALLFNFLIGNHDAHAKNYSMILEGAGAPRLAPLYDLVSTTVYQGLSRKLAMKVGGEYRPDYVRGRHLARMGADLEMGAPAVRDRAEAICERVLASIQGARMDLPTDFADRPILSRIEEVVRRRAALLRSACAELRE